MSRPRLVMAVALWEFRRYFRVRDLLLTLVLFVLGGLAVAGLGWLIERVRSGQVTVAVVNGHLLEPLLPEGGRIVLAASAGRDLDELQQALVDDELDGVLVLESIDRAELLVTGEPSWQDELRAALTASRRQARIGLAGLDPELVTQLTDPFDLSLRFPDRTGGRPDPSAKVVAFVLAGLVLMGVFLGNAYLLTSITGEKQQRVTEQIVTTIPAQIWIDGKILGLSLLSLVSIVTMTLSFLATNAVLGLLGRGLDLSAYGIDPVLLVPSVILAVLGFLLWFSFFAAIAATIDDPNTSARSTFLFLPLLALGTAFAVPAEPDALLFRVAGIFPLSSSSVLPARLAMTDVAWWEFLLAVVLLGGAIWILRLAAGKIFALGILMYGKEPTWSEMWRTLRATRTPPTS